MMWKGNRPDAIERNVMEGKRPPFSDQHQNFPALALINDSWAQESPQRPTFVQVKEIVLSNWNSWSPALI